MTNPIPHPARQSTTLPRLNLVWEDWLPMMESEDIPEDQKRAHIEAMWSIIVGFVDLGWGLSSNPKTCGKDIDLTAVLTAAVLNSGSQPKTEDA